MARIAFLQDYDIFSYQGGAEMNDAAQFAEGLKRGHEMILLSSQHPYAKYDLNIISNCVTFDKKRLLDITANTPTVYFLHDYVFCKYRLFYPMSEHCSECETTKFWLNQYLKAKLLIFLSPLHRDAHLIAMPELKDIPYILIPSAVNAKCFLETPEPAERKNVYLNVNGLYDFKGKNNLLIYISLHPDKEFALLAQPGTECEVPENAKLLEVQDYDKMPALFKQYKYYLELPATPQPFNRTIAEAKLSGCKVVTNQLMGAASYDWFKEAPEKYGKRLTLEASKFWEGIEQCL